MFAKRNAARRVCSAIPGDRLAQAAAPRNFHKPNVEEGKPEVQAGRKDGGGGGSRTRVRKCYWSRDYMLSPVPAPGITLGRSQPALRTDKKRLLLACDLSLPAQT